MSDNELAIARKAREATDEAAELRAVNARLVEQLDALRANASTLAIAPTEGTPKCHRCLAITVDDKRRIVKCTRCGSKLDPFDVLYEFATEERKLLQWNRHYRAEQAKLRNELDALKGDVAKARTERIQCPRGCRKFVAVSSSHAHGVTPHACYEARARLGLVPRVREERWRITDGEGVSRWVDHVTATRSAAKTEGVRVEEYAGPIGEKAERARDRAEHERQWRERMARRGS
jgi:hypothetical protein